LRLSLPTRLVFRENALTKFVLFEPPSIASASSRTGNRENIHEVCHLRSTDRRRTQLIDGSVEGLIHLDERKLTVGTTAKLTADINARDVVVYGYVKGNVRAKGRIEIKKDGSVIGNLTTAQIMIEDGADFKGSIEIDRSAEKEADKNVSSRVAAAAAGARPKSI